MNSLIVLQFKSMNSIYIVKKTARDNSLSGLSIYNKD